MHVANFLFQFLIIAYFIFAHWDDLFSFLHLANWLFLALCDLPIFNFCNMVNNICRSDLLFLPNFNFCNIANIICRSDCHLHLRCPAGYRLFCTSRHAPVNLNYSLSRNNAEVVGASFHAIANSQSDSRRLLNKIAQILI